MWENEIGKVEEGVCYNLKGGEKKVFEYSEGEVRD